MIDWREIQRSLSALNTANLGNRTLSFRHKADGAPRIDFSSLKAAK